MNYQKTLKTEVTLNGIGLHSGQPATVVLKPAKPNQGIVFVRSDMEGQPRIPAHFKNVINTQMATTLGRGQISISTVEHLLAALQGAGIDNLLVEVSGPEIPIMDGSSEPFVAAILSAGIQSQHQMKSFVILRKKVEVKIAERWAVAEPSSGLEVHASIDFDHPSIGYQVYHYIEGKTKFSELASARTFGFLKEVEMLKRMGLARGGSLENAVVVDEANVLNPGGLRFPDEFARHKVLDALGDLKLAGLPLRASIRLHRAGHDLHGQLLAAIFKDSSNYQIVDANYRDDEAESAPLHAILAHGW
jgi:UDP-3-O-[3-hydroxymyristoyl] N-acetylglucosamine deacetylase